MASIASVTQKELLQAFGSTGLEWLVPPDRANNPPLWDSLARYCSKQLQDPPDVPWSVAAPCMNEEVPWGMSLVDTPGARKNVPVGVPLTGYSCALQAQTATRPSLRTRDPVVSCPSALVGSGVPFFEAANNDADHGSEAAAKSVTQGANALTTVHKGPPASEAPPAREEPQTLGVLDPKDREAFLREIEGNEDDVDSYLLFSNALPAVKADRDSALAVVKQDGYALEHANDLLRRDKEIVLAAVTQSGAAFEFADDNLRSDKEFVLAAVTKNGFVLEYTADPLKSDKDVVLAAVTQNGMSLAYAHESLQRDLDVVLAAGQQNGAALEFAYADSRLNQDPDFLKASGLWEQKKKKLDCQNEWAIHADMLNVPPKKPPSPLLQLAAEHAHREAEATQQKYVPQKETASLLMQMNAEAAHWEAEATQQKYVPPKETPSSLVQVAAEPAHWEGETTQQRYVLPKETPKPLLQEPSVSSHFEPMVINHMLRASLLSGTSTEKSADEEGGVNLDVEGGDDSYGAPSKEILYASYILILTYWVIGFLYGRFSAGWSLIDSMYFVAVTVTTVGYGDKTFQGVSGIAKAFGGIYVFVGVLIISAAAGVILGALQAHTEARVKKMMAENEKKILEEDGGTPEFNLSSEIRGVFIDVSKGLILVGVALMSGCIGMMYFQDDWSFADAFYFCCVTMTTVGYGDLAPTNDGAKLFVTVYILFAFGVLASIMSEVGAIPFRIEELKKIDKCLSLLGDSWESEELAALCTAEEIVKIRNQQQLAEAEKDPFVSRAEFAIWQLIKQDKLSMDDVLRCMQTFDKLDEDGSGNLNQEDIDLFLQREKNSLQCEQNSTNA